MKAGIPTVHSRGNESMRIASKQRDYWTTEARPLESRRRTGGPHECYLGLNKQDSIHLILGEKGLAAETREADDVRMACASESDVGLFSRERGSYRSLEECPLRQLEKLTNAPTNRQAFWENENESQSGSLEAAVSLSDLIESSSLQVWHCGIFLTCLQALTQCQTYLT